MSDYGVWKYIEIELFRLLGLIESKLLFNIEWNFTKLAQFLFSTYQYFAIAYFFFFSNNFFQTFFEPYHFDFYKVFAVFVFVFTFQNENMKILTNGTLRDRNHATNSSQSN